MTTCQFSCADHTPGHRGRGPRRVASTATHVTKYPGTNAFPTSCNARFVDARRTLRVSTIPSIAMLNPVIANRTRRMCSITGVRFRRATATARMVANAAVAPTLATAATRSGTTRRASSNTSHHRSPVHATVWPANPAAMPRKSRTSATSCATRRFQGTKCRSVDAQYGATNVTRKNVRSDASCLIRNASRPRSDAAAHVASAATPMCSHPRVMGRDCAKASDEAESITHVRSSRKTRVESQSKGETSVKVAPSRARRRHI